MITPTRRRLLLGAAFIAALISAALAPSEDAAPPSKRAAKSPSGTVQQSQRVAAREIEMPQVSKYQRSLGKGVVVVNLFEPRSPPGAAPVATKPEPPKLPFSYVGRIEESGQLKVVLVQGDQMYIVAKGEPFGGSYRLDEVGSNEIVVVYVPLGARQSLPMGASQ
jgi:hypothetical protein